MRPAACPPNRSEDVRLKNGGHGAKSAFAHPTDWQVGLLRACARAVPVNAGSAAALAAKARNVQAVSEDLKHWRLFSQPAGCIAKLILCDM